MVNMTADMKNTPMPNQVLAASATSATSASREQISRWMDGDIAPHEIDLAMAALSREEGRYCWAEMHFVGDCIRGLENTPNGCADSIRAVIASEPAIIAPAGKRLRVQAQQRSLMTAMSSIAHLGKGGRAWATAAAVAAVGFVGTVVYKDQVAAPQVASIAPALNVAANEAVPLTRARADFNAYFQAHQESADVSSLSPMRQYMRPAVSVQVQ
jgi:negative regulator of sigma E activity